MKKEKKVISFETAKELGIINKATERLILTPIPRGLKELVKEREKLIKLFQVNFKTLTLIIPK